MKLTPYLCAHDARAALAFYGEAFGAVVDEQIEMPDGRMGHAEFLIDGERLFISDEFPELDVRSPQSLGGTSVMLHLEVADVDAAFDRAVAAGATALRQPVDNPDIGIRTAVVLDPLGHRWMFTK